MMQVGTVARSALSSLWRDEQVTVEGVKALGRGVEAEGPFPCLPDDNAGDFTACSIDGVSF